MLPRGQFYVRLEHDQWRFARERAHAYDAALIPARYYCGLPLQQTCPHPNACLTCDHFLTTAEFLPQHRNQLERTEQMIDQARSDGRQRLVEMNQPVRDNLRRIIDGLQALEEDGGER